MPSVNYTADPVGHVNVINVAPNSKPVVTFGTGVSTQELNDAMDKSGLFTMGAAAATVKPAGGFVQTAGHAPFSSKYGLAADNVLEFKVVTADGSLKVASSYSERDLFYALRGGGGGTFGVVVEATFRAFPSPKIHVAKWWISASNPNDTDAIYEPAAYIHGQFASLNQKGVQGYYYVYPTSMWGKFQLTDDEGSLDRMKKLWSPILAGITEFPGMKKELHQYQTFPSYKAWFDNSFGAAAPYDASAVVELEGAYPQGVAPMDSRLLSADHLSNAKLADALKEAMPQMRNGMLRGHLTAGGAVLKARGASVHPAWRKTLVHLIATGSGSFPNATSLKRLAPDMGCYANEVRVLLLFLTTY
jgi:hypothetical protein